LGRFGEDASGYMTKAQKFRWALQVSAPRLDMDDAIALYGTNSDPTIHSVGSDANPLFLLTSPQLEALAAAREVEDAATKLLAIVNGVLFVLEPERVPLTSGGVQERGADGNWIHHLTAIDLVARSRFHADGKIVGAQPSPQRTRPAPALRWTAMAQTDELVGHVFRYLSGKPDWFDYYNAFDLMRDDITRRLGGQRRQEQMGWPAKKDLDHFTLSAQVYRHAPPWDAGYTPANAMPLCEARYFMRSLANIWLTWRFP
jgi:hypothetical protein